MRAGELIRTSYCSVTADDSISSALAKLEARKHHSAVVVDTHDRYVGMLDKESCLHSRGDLTQTKVRRVVRKTAKIEESMDVVRVAQLLLASDVHVLPVLDKYKRPAGIVGARDIILSLIDKLHGMRVSEAASRYPTTVNEESTVANVIELMRRQKVKRLPVVNAKRKLLGVVTLFDILKRFVAQPVPTRCNRAINRQGRAGTYGASTVPSASEINVKNIMVRQVETIAPDASLQLAARRMVSSQLSDLVVVQDNVPVGVLTTRDILKVLVR